MMTDLLGTVAMDLHITLASGGMEMPIIAMTREMGSGGVDIARGLADACDVHLIHRELVEHQIAGKLHVRESAVHRYLEGNANFLERWRMDKKSLARCTADEIFALAERGNILIRGWGAAQLLRGVSHVLCVRVCAPMDLRARRLMERTGIKAKSEVLREIRTNDAAHARIVRDLFDLDWENPLSYDLVINTERTATNEAIALIRNLAGQPSFRETEQSRSKLADLRVKAGIHFSTRGVYDSDEAELVHHQRMKRHEFSKTREDSELL